MHTHLCEASSCLHLKYTFFLKKGNYLAAPGLSCETQYPTYSYSIHTCPTPLRDGVKFFSLQIWRGLMMSLRTKGLW